MSGRYFDVLCLDVIEKGVCWMQTLVEQAKQTIENIV